jgi:hypothetical protein
VAKQLALALCAPAEHGDFVHGENRHGTVVIWQQKCRREWLKVEPTDDLARAMTEHFGHSDRYFTPNEFHQWRRVDLLRSLRACYIDLDGFRDWPAVLDEISSQGLPEPSLIVESGRGLHLYWTLEPVPAKALPVWQAIQDTLLTKLALFGADAAARDCTRVLRIVGSVNSKNEAPVLGWVISPRRWTLHELADAVLGPRKTRKPADVMGLEGVRVKRQASVHQRTGPYRLWHSRYQDLCKLADFHAFMRGIGEGNRDTMLFLMANALSWFTAADTLQDGIMRVAKTYTPSLSHQQVNTYTKPIVARALAAQRGETVEWQGSQRDPRYAFKTSTLRSWLAPLIVPEIEGKLEVLGVPKSEEELQSIRTVQKAKHEKTRSRVQEGRYEQTRTEYTNTAAERAQRAFELREQGLTQAAIGAALGITQGRVAQLLKCARPCIAPRRGSLAPQASSPYDLLIVSSPQAQRAGQGPEGGGLGEGCE